MPPRRHVTPRMIAANRANARRSTGPRTPEGKARSRCNGLVHGLRAGVLARPLLETADDHAAFDDLLAALRAEFTPAGPSEESILLTLAESCLGLRRALRVEAAAIVAEAEAGANLPLLPVGIMSSIFRYEIPFRRRFRQSVRALRCIRAQRRHLAQFDAVPQAVFGAQADPVCAHDEQQAHAGPVSPPASAPQGEQQAAVQKEKSPSEPNLHPSLRIPAAPDPVTDTVGKLRRAGCGALACPAEWLSGHPAGSRLGPFGPPTVPRASLPTVSFPP